MCSASGVAAPSARPRDAFRAGAIVNDRPRAPAPDDDDGGGQTEDTGINKIYESGDLVRRSLRHKEGGRLK